MERSRGAKDGQSRGQRNARSTKGRGTGRGGRGHGGFSGSLTNLSKAPAKDGETSRSSGSSALNNTITDNELYAGQNGLNKISETDQSLKKVLAPPSAAEEGEEAELCFICAEPVQLYSVPPCNHRTCHVCAIRLRALYKKKECTFCKAPSEVVIFTSDGERDYLSFSPDDIPFKDEKLGIYFESATSREDSLILLRFNCPESYCDYVASSWADLRAHAKSEHERFFCDLCIKHSRIFAHEHKLYTTSELNRHIRSEHKYCDFCNSNFYSSDELYIHMRDKHEQCFLCKRSETRGDEYQKDYKMLEKHFKSDHYLCESKECLEKKFVVFDSEMDYKAHQVAEHGTELSSREKREALRVTANFHFDASSSAARHNAGQAGSSGLTARGKPKKEEEPETKRDVLGISALASRSHVPGAGGAADHQSRRAQFGSTLTVNGDGHKEKGKNGSPATALADTEEKREKEREIQKHQRYMDQVYDILIRSDSKMASFRANVKVYRAGETSSKDLVDSIYSLVGDIGQVEVIILGLIELMKENDKREDVLKSLNMLRLERTQFPSLVPSSLNASGASNAAKGQLRNAKANSSSNINSRIWENVERAASSGGGYGGMAARSTVNSRDHFPSLGVTKSQSSNAAIVPGSIHHSAMANSSLRGTGTAWAGVSNRGNNATIPNNSSGRSTPTVQPYSVEVTRDPERSNKTSVKSHPNAFPTLSSNSSAANLAAYKRSLFEGRVGASGSGSGDSSPKRAIWGSSLGRIDGGEEIDATLLHDKLGEAQISDRRKGKQKNVLVTLGSMRRG